MALALRLFLLLLLAVALTARAAQAAPWRAKEADEHAGKASPAPWLHEDLLPLEPPAVTGVSADKTFQEPFLVALGKPSSQESDEHAWKPSPTPWHHEDLLPLQPPADVSAGKRLQGPLLIASGKPSSHHMGLLRGRNKPTGPKSLKASKHLKPLLSDLERLRELQGKPVLKEAFPRRRSGTLLASTEGSEVIPKIVTGDEHVRKPPPAPWLHEDLLPLKPPASVSARKRLQGPLLVASGKPSSHHRGLLRGRNKPTGDIKSQKASKHLDKIRSYLEIHHDAVGVSRHDKTMWKRMRSVFCWETHCLLKLMAIVAGGALLLMMCFAGIWYCYKRKQCSCADTEEQPKGTGSDNLPRDSSPCQSPCALAWLHPRLRCTPAPPKRAALPPSPLALLPGPG
ncbi:uncharacterized protein LOC130249053 [Oenanthe melanoleuca]|uniref:uncharacterized protein LOC130249053 n=1 Tax=Oenanthe melanoleuca TaxID=2939378 RepID=UPI0024C18660|nr:uncharacterized protein LOC130249053 [Oenanthe melanoleuca]